MCLLVFWPIFDTHCDPRPWFYFFFWFLFMCLHNRIAGVRRASKGDPFHRHYVGFPKLMKFSKVTDEMKFKQKYEPLLLLGFGGAAMCFYPLLGSFMIASAIGLFIHMNAIAFAEREQVEAMQDQMLAQQILIERFRYLSGK